jgi:hypothetical protein
MVTTPYWRDANSNVINEEPGVTENLADIGLLFDQLHAQGLAVGYKVTLIPRNLLWATRLEWDTQPRAFPNGEAQVISFADKLDVLGLSAYVPDERPGVVGVGHWTRCRAPNPLPWRDILRFATAHRQCQWG